MMKLLVIGVFSLVAACTTTPQPKDVFSGSFVGTLGTTTQQVARTDLSATSMRPDFPIAAGFVVYESLYLLLNKEQMQNWSLLSGRRVTVTCTLQQGPLFGADSIFCQPSHVAVEP